MPGLRTNSTSMILATRYGFLRQCGEQTATSNHVIIVFSICVAITFGQNLLNVYYKIIMRYLYRLWKLLLSKALSNHSLLSQLFCLPGYIMAYTVLMPEKKHFRNLRGGPKYNQNRAVTLLSTPSQYLRTNSGVPPLDYQKSKFWKMCLLLTLLYYLPRSIFSGYCK